MSVETCRLVFTDLDGTLLDHDSYSPGPALEQLRLLEEQGIPVIPVTSKTRAEVEVLRRELGNGHPFVVENGAAVFVPVDYFTAQPAGTCRRDDYWVHEIAAGRDRWLSLLAALEDDFQGEFEYFYRAGSAGIAAMTGLTEEQARLANQREYSEPVQWRGDEERRQDFVARLEAAGATVIRGGRFLNVGGAADKGRALLWLRATYRDALGAEQVVDLAAGDSPNDRPMLEQAGTALMVRSPHHGFPQVRRSGPVIYSRHYGPAGWTEGLQRWLASEHTRGS